MFEATTAAETITLNALPSLGQPLAGGIFCGLTTTRDGTHCAVVLIAAKPAENLAWQAAMAWAKDINAELPTRAVSALLFANTRDQFEQGWHWTADEFDGSYAWLQSFNDGYQGSSVKSFRCRARAVRLIHLTT